MLYYSSEGVSAKQSILTVGVIFITSLSALLYVYTTFPELAEYLNLLYFRDERQHMKLPLHIEEAKNLGSIFLSILSGFLFPFPLAWLLVCTCSAVGASLCYFLSSLLGQKAREWSLTVKKNENNLFNYMLFLRITPLLPNWFINLASPVIGVPLAPFALGTFFGVAPPSFIAIQAGKTLQNLTSSTDAWSWNSIIVLCICAILPLVPIIFKQKVQQKYD
ncbi:hypothetical protein E2986_08878 [Frieseomelitta varia]|uniref:VTT domain-containing protein n=1 Tax=Frieseomelitta varia TaxID=561572 RepID=A0A833S379_9HYME|nr:hypothetical protein E2986_08878 [Frieseomelitta varia]